MTDNGRKFSNSMIDKLCEKFKSKQYKSCMYNAAANELAEAFNKTICYLLKKIVYKSKRDWQERIDEAFGLIEPLITLLQGLHHIRLFTVYRLSFPSKKISSLRMAMQEGLTTEDNVKLRLQELEDLMKSD
ncbi:uncharacterized protein LOC103489785 [Cucumis melo]|uniref:Uncharacterized protein LOC103489785 n=1 Tax=Cucumis melo TaxID=3656 RepID=A0A1S3BHR7_CUCME|nr:uncharacterized protein LOC103489785 [Cucumis melo]